MQTVKLRSQIRHIFGRKTKSLRSDGFLPAIMYGHGFEPIAIQVNAKDFTKVYSEVGESTILYLDVGDQSHPTIIHDVSRDPISGLPMHADFYKVRLDEKIKADIQFNFIGESPAVKNLAGILIKNMSEVEVEGLPQDLPHVIDVDLSGLAEFGSEIRIRNLSISDKLEIKADPESLIVLVKEPMSEEEMKAQFEVPTASAEDVEVIKKEKPEEAEAAEEAPELDKGAENKK